MKNIIYILIAVFAISILSSSLYFTKSQKKSLLVQASGPEVTALLLSQSADIISGRLKDYCSDPFQISTIPGNKQIYVEFSENWDLKVASKLMTQIGKLAFYENYDPNSSAPLLTNSDVQSMTTSRDQENKNWFVDITLRQEVWSIWSDATRRNIGKPIVIVIDNEIIASPVVNDAIGSGKCTISGAFTKKDVSYIAAIGNNMPLPLVFQIIK
jgi:hypothetical protein